MLLFILCKKLSYNALFCDVLILFLLNFTWKFKFYLNPHILFQTAIFDKNSKYSIKIEYLFQASIFFFFYLNVHPIVIP